MTQAREPLGIMDGTQQNCDFSTKGRRGIFLSRNLAWIIAVIFALALISTSFIVYNFAACPRTDQLANVTKYELHNHNCDHNTNLLVVPLPTEPSHSVVGIEKKIESSIEDTNLSHSNNETSVPKLKDLRLPKTLLPTKYFIKIAPYIFEGNFTFDAEISIELNAVNDTNKVIFHGVELTFHNIIIYEEEPDGSYLRINIVRQIEDSERQFHILELGETLRAGETYKLNITYTGILNDYLRGFYRSSYVEKNTTRWIAVTQFQPTDARRAFPCFDEPALKARFTISIARPRNMSSVSNMNSVGNPQKHESLPDYVWDHYAESLPMSTYLVAFAVTDFSRMGESNFKVWARHEALSSATYALEIGPKILKFFEEYYKIKFPLPKIDMMALPDFKAGAMENWGLITFREIAMLYQKEVSPRAAQTRVASVVAHELAHQWFGNLVTPAWWSDVWLNEGFASYLEYGAVDAIEKSWKIMEMFVLDEIQSVFRLDVLASSHQISVEVDNPEEIKDIFDKISYGKGASILRMMNHFLTDKVFNEGLTDYLNVHKYGNAEQNDLWRALTTAARRHNSEAADVAVVMDSWTLQTGFPVLTITRDYGSNSISFVQERFTLGNTTSDRKTSSVWWIPVSYTTASERNFIATGPKLWLKGTSSLTITNDTIDPEDWLIANIQQTGFYRVNYDKENWDKLIEVLNNKQRFKDIHAINRAQIIDDAMNLALASQLSYKTALDITKYLEHEQSYVPWKAGLRALGYIDAMLSKGAYYLEYKKYMVGMLGNVLKELGWEAKPGENVVRAQHRADIMATACHLEHAECLQNAVRLYTNWMMTPNPDTYNEIGADVRGAVYCVGVQAGGAREWTFAWERFRAASEPSEREQLITVLGCTRAPYLLYRYLDLSMRNDSGIRKQDVIRVFSAVASSSVGQSIAFNFVRANWNLLRDHCGSYSTLSSIVKAVTWGMNQPYELEEIQKFATEHFEELGRPMQQVLERTEANVQWMDKNYQTIVDWLLTTGSSTSTS